LLGKTRDVFVPFSCAAMSCKKNLKDSTNDKKRRNMKITSKRKQIKEMGFCSFVGV
jgi:hypothetical protein